MHIKLYAFFNRVLLKHFNLVIVISWMQMPFELNYITVADVISYKF